MKGTVRTFHEEERLLLEHEIEELLKATCYLTKADYEYEYVRGYPPVVNHEAETDHIIASAEKIADVESVEIVDPNMGGEDFAYFLEEIPGAFFFTGAKILIGRKSIRTIIQNSTSTSAPYELPPMS